MLTDSTLLRMAREDVSQKDIETIMVAMRHLLHSSPDTHNGEQTTLAGELHKLDYIVSSIDLWLMEQ